MFDTRLNMLYKNKYKYSSIYNILNLCYLVKNKDYFWHISIFWQITKLMNGKLVYFNYIVKR